MNPTQSLPSRVNEGISKARNVTLNLLFLVFVLVVLALLVTSCQSVQVPSDAALVVNPRGVVVEKLSLGDPISEALSGESRIEAELTHLLGAIQAAADDENIKAMVLDLDELAWAAPAHAFRLGQAIERFKSKNKKVIAYSYFYNQSAYQIASHADELYMHPLGQVGLYGYGNYSFYFNELLEKINVKVHVFRVGEFKSAVEPYTRNDMSPEARMANSALYENLWQTTVETIGANRALEHEDVRRYANAFDTALEQTGGDLARTALEYHLVDELLTDDQARVRIGETVGFNQDRDINGIDYLSYLEATGYQPASGHSDSPTSGDDADMDGHSGKVAVIVAQGIITNAKHNNGVIGANPTIALIRQVRRDPEIKALVMRVDSPGGSQFASELIRQELELVQLAGKPVITSFGASATSGGYWIAATSDHIVAEPSTITGSIGIFALTTSFEQSLAKIGVQTDGVGTTDFAQGFSPFTGMSEKLSNVLQSQVEHGYQQFIELVARGRNLEVDTVAEIAQGRVWVGEVAHELGLVDSLGGLETAIEEAAENAQLTSWEVAYLSQPVDARQLLLQQLLTAREGGLVEFSLPGTTSLLNRALGELTAITGLLDHLDDPYMTYVLCETCQWQRHVATASASPLIR
ncbi:MAG: signal peptide peptidase SppA [Pseudomonadota bacterium]